MIQTLNNDQIDNLLLGQVTGRLGCTDGNKPYIFPVTYCYDGRYIYGQTNDGTKLKMVRQNPQVCFEVDSVLDPNHWQSVIISGEFEELTDNEIVEARKLLFNRIFQLMTNNRAHAHEHGVATEVDDSNRIKDVIWRIEIKEVSGRMLSLSAP